MHEVILEMKGITKQFPGVKALDQVDLTLHKGEVLALLGENGAGKSTLLKILSGVLKADEGDVILEGQKQNFQKPSDGYDAGISVIHQELNYLDELTIAENIFLGRLPKKRGLVDWKRTFVDAKIYLDKIGFDVDPKKKMSELSIAEKQLVEIAKATSRNMKVLIMDEPTAALNDEEVKSLLVLVKKIASEGTGVAYISHRLNEIFEVSDNIQVMRDGKRVAYFKTDEVNESILVEAMVGRDISDMYPKEQIPTGDVIFNVENLSTESVFDINFNLKSGEVLGIFGLMGCGRSKVAEAIFGNAKLQTGVISVDNKVVKLKTPEDAKKAGISYVPAERKSEGLILCQSVEQNISTATLSKIKRNNLINSKVESSNAIKWIKDFSIKTPAKETLVESLSGGNQQKVVLAKWLQADPKILILNEPTRGIDVGAKVEIYKLMEKSCKAGMGVIMISSELPEVLALSDRVLVMSEGTIVGEVDKSQFSQEKLMHLAVSRVH